MNRLASLSRYRQSIEPQHERQPHLVDTLDPAKQRLYSVAITTSELCRLVIEWSDDSRLHVDREEIDRVEDLARAFRGAFWSSLPVDQRPTYEATRENLTEKAEQVFDCLLDRSAGTPWETWHHIVAVVLSNWDAACRGELELTERKPAARIVSLELAKAMAKRKAQEPRRPVCRHGVPLDLDCGECHGIDEDASDGGSGAA